MSKKTSLTLILRLFFITKGLFVLLRAADILPSFAKEKASWLWPVAFLNSISHPEYFLYFTACLSIALNVLCVFKPFSVKIKMTEFLTTFLFLAGCFSFGKIDHSFHGYILASFFIFLIKDDQDPGQLLMRGASGIFLLTYFLSGLWKLRFLMGSGFIDGIRRAVGYQLGINMIMSGQISAPAMYVLSLPDILQALIWGGVIIFELAALFFILRPRLTSLYGMMVILFHVSAWIVMDISFLEAQVLSLILLILYPLSGKKFSVATR